MSRAGARIDPVAGLRVLLIADTGDEPTFWAWKGELEREGVPFDTHLAGRAGSLSDLVRDDSAAPYNAVVVAVDGPAIGSGFLRPNERAMLEQMERVHGVRRVTAYVVPSPAVGLGHGTYLDRADVDGRLTAAGHRAFPSLRGPVPIDPGASAYLTQPLDDRFETFVEGPNGSALVGVCRHPDGREELVTTVDANFDMLHFQLLRHGMLSWVTRGVHLGFAQDDLSLHIDDVFFINARWDPETRMTLDEAVRPIRMTEDDALQLVHWQENEGCRVDLVYNGADVEANPHDELHCALLGARDRFRWINHTFDHAILDDADASTIERSIEENIRFAERVGIATDRSELVTGAHSGLGRDVFAEAIAAAGVRWVASDASYGVEQEADGPALTVPRYPTGLYANAATRRELLDEDDHLHGRDRVGDAATERIRWDQYVDREATAIFRHVVGNDPRPHFFHQSNLAEERCFYTVIDEVLARYRRYFTTELRNPSMAEAGTLLRRQTEWRVALRAGWVSGWRTGDSVTITADVDVVVPVAFLSAWIPISAGMPTIIPIANTPA